MQMTRAIEEFLRDLEHRQQRAKSTVAAYRSDLGRLRHLTPRDTVLQLTADVVRRYFVTLSEEGQKPASLHRKAAAVREFVKWGQGQRLWSSAQDDLIRAIPEIKRPEGVPRPFSVEEITALWALDLPANERILRAVLFYTGLRVSEIIAIRFAHITQEPPMVRVIQKGGKERVVHMHPRLADAVVSYALERTDLKPQNHLVTDEKGRPLDRRDAEDMTKRWGSLAGVPDCLPHRFRHTFGTELYRGTGDIRAVAEAMGHADLKSTKGYAKIHDEQIRRALLKLPESWA